MFRLLLISTFVAGVWTFKINRKSNCGQEASSNLIHHNPWVVYLEYWREDFHTGVRCTATLIDDQHLITAAHCIKPSRYTRLVARLGEYNLVTVVDCVAGVCSPAVIRLEVVDAIVHPDYAGFIGGHDIALLRLESPAPYTDFIRPICLPSGELQPDITLIASGWGYIPLRRYYSTVKKIIPLPLWDRADCVAAYKDFEVPTNVICAGGVEGVDTCRGDSGGPLVWVRERSELWGVTSAGKVNCGTKGFPGFYTNVADHLDWILTVIEKLNTRYTIIDV